ncbi:MAG: hypothetical protein JJU46_06300 [Balneolaceae bacterium]|nr:hypothetical protein [Balneolaceae bacterium]MCH8548192.1 hypothetical protein [Balneolaceae bacterium]
MKIIGIIILLSGLVFILVTLFSEPETTTGTTSWAIWVGILVFITGGITYYVPRDEE